MEAISQQKARSEEYHSDDDQQVHHADDPQTRRHRRQRGHRAHAEVNELRGQVAQLDCHKSLVEHKQLLGVQKGSLVSKILKYYELFRFGLVQPSSSDSSSFSSCWVAYERQVAYYHRMTADGIVRGDELVSPNVVLELWKRVTLFQPEYEMTVLSCELLNPADTPTVRVQALMKYRITRTTIENLFPHVLRNESLVQLLVGKKLECLMNCDYVFDDRHRVFQHSIDVDTLAGLQKLLQKLDVTLEVMQHALITDNYFVGKWSDDKEAEVEDYRDHYQYDNDDDFNDDNMQQHQDELFSTHQREP